MVSAVANKQINAGKKASEASQKLTQALHKSDKAKQVPVETHHQLSAMLMAIAALGESRITVERISQTEGKQIQVISKEMNASNNRLAGITGYVNIAPGLTGGDLSKAISAAQTDNESIDARRSIVQAQYGNLKLNVQQKQSEVGASVNAVVQDLQMESGMVSQLGQLSNTICGR